jgi:transposase
MRFSEVRQHHRPWVVIERLTPHHAPRVQVAIHARGARLLFLPPYSPDLSPIQTAFSKIKQALPRLRAQTLDALDQALQSITPVDAIDFFVEAAFFDLD